MKLIKLYGSKNWKKIAEDIPTKTHVQCLHRYTKILKPGLKKGPWTIEEDKKLLEWVKMEGPRKWSQCSDFITGRSGKQIRERWANTLNPSVTKGNWTEEEDAVIFKSFAILGSKWAQIALHLPGRTENSIKNRFYSTLRRIAAESRKIEKSADNDDHNLLSNDATSLNSLLKYFPVAFEEKTKLSKEMINNQRTCTEFLNKKLQRDRSFSALEYNLAPSSQIQRSNSFNNYVDNMNVLNFNTNCNLDDLEGIIDNYCCDSVKVYDNKINKIEYTLNNLIRNCKDIKSTPNDKSQNQISSGKEKLSNFISQLNELEEILKNAKQEISLITKTKTSQSLAEPLEYENKLDPCVINNGNTSVQNNNINSTLNNFFSNMNTDSHQLFNCFDERSSIYPDNLFYY